MVFYVIILAMVAAFLALRLYSVLGKRTGHEHSFKPAEERISPPHVRPAVAPHPETREIANPNIAVPAEKGLRAIIAADSGFDVTQFLDGARSAYRMTLEAFWKGDAETLKFLAEEPVQRAFGEAIAARHAAGHTLENRLVSIESATIQDAVVEGRLGRITIRFDADIAAVTRDAEGNVVAGSMSDAVQTHDLWTFVRQLRSDDPNWILAETDEA